MVSNLIFRKEMGMGQPIESIVQSVQGSNKHRSPSILDGILEKRFFVSRSEGRRYPSAWDTMQELRYAEMAHENTLLTGAILILGRRTRNGLCWCAKGHRGKHIEACARLRGFFQEHLKFGRVCEKCWLPLAPSDQKEKRKRHDKCPD